MNKENRKIELSEKDFEFICPVKTDEMIVIDGGYFCNDCEKKVYDVSDYTQDEFRALKTNRSGLCINFKKIDTTSLILGSTLCVAADATSKQQNSLAPVAKFNLNQTVFIEHKKVVELGGGAVPILIFEEEYVEVPVEPIEIPPSKEDDNSTKSGNCKVF